MILCCQSLEMTYISIVSYLLTGGSSFTLTLQPVVILIFLLGHSHFRISNIFVVFKMTNYTFCAIFVYFNISQIMYTWLLTILLRINLLFLLGNTGRNMEPPVRLNEFHELTLLCFPKFCIRGVKVPTMLFFPRQTPLHEVSCLVKLTITSLIIWEMKSSTGTLW